MPQSPLHTPTPHAPPLPGLRGPHTHTQPFPHRLHPCSLTHSSAECSALLRDSQLGAAGPRITTDFFLLRLDRSLGQNFDDLSCTAAAERHSRRTNAFP